jgi:predicted RNA-binding protein with PUA-like domain
VAANYYLVKTEPLVYSIGQLRHDKRTTWDGIKNPQALKAIRAMRSGDRVFIYHSGGESAIVGIAEVVGEPRPDPNEPKLAVVDVKYITGFEPPATLAEIKGSHLFDDWSLVRQGRLSAMPAPAQFVEWMKSRYPGTKL